LKKNVELVIPQHTLGPLLQNKPLNQSDHSGRIFTSIYDISKKNKSAIGVAPAFVISQLLDKGMQMLESAMDIANDVDRAGEKRSNQKGHKEGYWLSPLSLSGHKKNRGGSEEPPRQKRELA